MSFLAVFRLKKLKPGRADKRELVESTCELADMLGNHIDILIHSYGHDTTKHMPIAILGDKGWQTVDAYQYLSQLRKDVLKLAHIRDVTIRNINKEPGKKTGNNSNDLIPGLIHHLVGVYGELTDNKAEEHFQQDPVGSSPYKGQFYEFVRCVFQIINENYPIRYPNTHESNPFDVDFENENGEESYSLGKYIQKVFRLSAGHEQIKSPT